MYTRYGSMKNVINTGSRLGQQLLTSIGAGSKVPCSFLRGSYGVVLSHALRPGSDPGSYSQHKCKAVMVSHGSYDHA